MPSKKFVVSDGRMVLHLQPAGGGWYAVTSPLEPAITTQAKSIEDAFLMAYDAQKCLRAARAESARRREQEASSATIRPQGRAVGPRTKARRRSVGPAGD